MQALLRKAQSELVYTIHTSHSTPRKTGVSSLRMNRIKKARALSTAVVHQRRVSRTSSWIIFGSGASRRTLVPLADLREPRPSRSIAVKHRVLPTMTPATHGITWPPRRGRSIHLSDRIPPLAATQWLSRIGLHVSVAGSDQADNMAEVRTPGLDASQEPGCHPEQRGYIYRCRRWRRRRRQDV